MMRTNGGERLPCGYSPSGKTRRPADALHEQLGKTKRPEGRIAVLYALSGADALSDADLLNAMADEHPQVRRHALRLSESRLNESAELRAKALSLLSDPDPAVQFQLALSLGECQDSTATRALAEILRRSATDRDIADAALTSIAERAGAVLTELLADEQLCRECGKRADTQCDRRPNCAATT